MGIKNANGYVGGTVRLTNKKSTANMGIIFWLAKQKRNFFRVPLKNLLSKN
jgi:hypothetical protein